MSGAGRRHGHGADARGEAPRRRAGLAGGGDEGHLGAFGAPPGSRDRRQSPHRARRARRLPRRRDPRAAGRRPPGHHHPRQLRRRDAGDDRPAGHRRARRRRGARARREVDLLDQPLRLQPRRRRVQRDRRHQRRRERPSRRRRQRPAAASRRGRRHLHREGGRQFRCDHAARRHRREHVDPGPDAARRGQRRGPAVRGGRRRRGDASSATASRSCAC